MFVVFCSGVWCVLFMCLLYLLCFVRVFFVFCSHICCVLFTYLLCFVHMFAVFCSRVCHILFTCLLRCCRHAGGGVEADPAGAGGRLGVIQEGAGAVCGAAAGDAVSAGLQDGHRPRGAAALQGLLLQGAYQASVSQNIFRGKKITCPGARDK